MTEAELRARVKELEAEAYNVVVYRQYLDGVCAVLNYGPGYEGLSSHIEHGVVAERDTLAQKLSERDYQVKGLQNGQVALLELAHRYEKHLAACRVALRRLMRESVGFVNEADPAAHGHTNIAVMRHHIEQSRAVLSDTEQAAREHDERTRADERERCAQVAESYEPHCESCPRGVALAIRALGKPVRPDATSTKRVDKSANARHGGKP